MLEVGTQQLVSGWGKQIEQYTLLHQILNSAPGQVIIGYLHLILQEYLRYNEFEFAWEF